MLHRFPLGDSPLRLGCAHFLILSPMMAITLFFPALLPQAQHISFMHFSWVRAGGILASQALKQKFQFLRVSTKFPLTPNSEIFQTATKMVLKNFEYLGLGPQSALEMDVSMCVKPETSPIYMVEANFLLSKTFVTL